MATLMQFTPEDVDATKLNSNGEIYTGELSDGRKVAVKKVVAESGGIGTVQRITAVPRNNNNILDPIGYMLIEGEKYVLIVYDFLPSLDTILLLDDAPLDWASRVQIAVGVARGMSFLHDLDIMYGSLGPSKIVLDEQLQPKLREAAIAVLDYGTAPYVDPFYPGNLEKPNDVYSFGKILLALIGPGLDGIADPRLGGKYDRNQLARMVKLGVDCAVPPGNRLNMRQVLEILENLSKEGKSEEQQEGDPQEGDPQEGDPQDQIVIDDPPPQQIGGNPQRTGDEDWDWWGAFSECFLGCFGGGVPGDQGTNPNFPG